MTDSPYFKSPMDPQEQPILNKLLIVRDKLLLLKQDRSQYIKSQDVMKYYEELIGQVHDLNELRTTKPDEQNRLDNVLDDCFQLVSLFFLTIGRNNEAPASYAVASTIKRLLDHLKEAGFVTRGDLAAIEHHLDKMQETVTRGRSKHSDEMLLLLDNRIRNCRSTLADLKHVIDVLSPELAATYDKLVMILRSLSGLNTRGKFPVDEVKEFQRQLREIEAGLEGHPQAVEPSDLSIEAQYENKLRHLSYDANAVSKGEDVVVDLLGRCLLWSEVMLHRQGKLDERFKEQFTELNKIRNQLEKLALTQAWSLRETDLYGYQRSLNRYDESRVNGHFLDAEGKPADMFEQRALLYLLRKSYAIIYHMITSSEPVSEALLPIYNQLMTLRKCLIEVKNSGGVSSPRELYPYSMKLNSIDNMREDGKFIVNGDIPEGQGSVTALLSECFELQYELRMDAEGDDENDDDDEEDHDEDGIHDEHAHEADLHDMEHDDDEGMGLARTISRKPGAEKTLLAGLTIGVK